MKRILSSLFLLTILSVASAFAQTKVSAKHQQWMQEMKQAKLEFMIKELQIKDNQKAKFTEAFNAMEAELCKVRNETNKMRRAVEKKKDATDLEYEKAAEAIVEAKIKEGNIEKKYFDRFKTILSSEQLFRMKKADMKWMKELMKHRKK